MATGREYEKRLKLHTELISILGTENERESRVYFQPPASVKMRYPAIVYQKDGRWTYRADNLAYIGKQRYTIIVIDQDPDSDIAVRITEKMALCEIDRSYIADNLHHDVITLYW